MIAAELSASRLLIGQLQPAPASHWSMSHGAPGHWAPTVPHPAIVWCLLQQSTFSLSRQQRVTFWLWRSSMPVIFWVIAEAFRKDKQPPQLILSVGSLSGCKVEAIIYKVKTGWVPLDPGEKLLLPSDWSALVILASDWSQSSDLAFIDQALAGATRWSVQVSDFRGINPESEQTFGGPLDLRRFC